MNRELIVVVMPSGSLQLEWKNAEETVGKSSRILQEEIYRRFTSDKDSWLLFLGFSNARVSFSHSLDYWRNFTGLFAKKNEPDAGSGNPS